jgi:hypothetical protein
VKRAKKANQTKAPISGRGRRAPAWVRELERLELGVRGQCPSCDKWGTLQNGICLRAPTLHQPQPDSQRKRLRYSDLKLCTCRNPCLNLC